MNSSTPNGSASATHPDTAPAAFCSDLPDMPPPRQEHAWLQQFVGEWDSEIEMFGPDERPGMKTAGTERAEMVGGFWLISEGRNSEFPFVCRLTLGFDPERERYIGTWVDSMSSYLWHYEGTVDGSGTVLTLETQGPFPPVPNAPMVRFREVTEFRSKNHRVFTSTRLERDGRWVPCLRIQFRRRGT